MPRPVDHVLGRSAVEQIIRNTPAQAPSTGMLADMPVRQVPSTGVRVGNALLKIGLGILSVATLGAAYGIYKLATRQSPVARAQSEVRDATKQIDRSVSNYLAAYAKGNTKAMVEALDTKENMKANETLKKHGYREGFHATFEQRLQKKIDSLSREQLTELQLVGAHTPLGKNLAPEDRAMVTPETVDAAVKKHIEQYEDPASPAFRAGVRSNYEVRAGKWDYENKKDWVDKIITAVTDENIQNRIDEMGLHNYAPYLTLLTDEKVDKRLSNLDKARE